MKIAGRLAWLIVGCWVAWWLWSKAFPNEEQRIARTLRDLAATASFRSADSDLARLAKVSGLTRFFTADVVVNLEIENGLTLKSRGINEIMQAAQAAPSLSGSVEVQLPDVVVTLEPDGQSAQAHVTALIRQSSQKEFNLQELKFQLKREDDQWRVARVDSVGPLLKVR